MYFVLSKILAVLIFPVTWLFILFICALASKQVKKRKIFLWAAFILFYTFSNNFLINLFADKWDATPATLPNGAKYSCAILLGGFSGADSHDRGYFNEGADRFIQAVELYKTGTVNYILVSGGNGSIKKESFREASWTVNELVKAGVPESAIIIENNSRNTLENAAFTKSKLAALPTIKPPFLLVTSAYHMPRAEMIFSRYGLQTIPYPCNYIAGRHKYGITDLLPQSEAFNNWTYYIKEVIGYIACYFKTRSMQP